MQGGTSIVDWAETNDWANANDRVEQAELASAAEDSARLLEGTAAAQRAGGSTRKRRYFTEARQNE